jgi:hypothetical protein
LTKINQTQITQRREFLWRIGRFRFSIRLRAFGHLLIAPKGLEVFLFVVSPDKQKPLSLCYLFVSVVKVNDF